MSRALLESIVIIVTTYLKTRKEVIFQAFVAKLKNICFH